MPDKTKEDKSAPISKIWITRAENGFIYRACSESDNSNSPNDYEEKNYVYENIDDVLAAVKDDLESPHLRGYPPRAAADAAFKEVHENEPKVVGETRAKKGPSAARKQLIAIALSKARNASGGIFKK